MLFMHHIHAFITAVPDFTKIVRNVLVDKPRVTRFPIGNECIRVFICSDFRLVEWSGEESYSLGPPIMMETSSSSLDQDMIVCIISFQKLIFITGRRAQI
jgi:hypothetical protein